MSIFSRRCDMCSIHFASESEVFTYNNMTFHERCLRKFWMMIAERIWGDLPSKERG